MKMRQRVLVGLAGSVIWGLLGGLAETQGVIDQTILPAAFRTTWDPGIPGGIPADDDPVRPATVWLPAGNPHDGYSVDPALTGTANAAAFTTAFQAAINAAGAAATPTARKIVRLKAGTYFVNPQVIGGRTVGILVTVDNVTIRGEGASRTRLVASGPIGDLGTVILFGHRRGNSDATSVANFLLRNVTADALRGTRTIDIADATGYTVGDIITIDHEDGPPEASGLATINGGYLFFFDSQFFKRQPNDSWQGPGTGAPAFTPVTSLASANTVARNIVPRWRSTSQETEIVGVAGNTVTVKDPLVIDFPLSMNPQVWRTVAMNSRTVPVGNRWCGIEYVSVAGGSNPIGFPGGGVAFSYMAYAWAKAIEVDGQLIASDPTHPGKRGHSIGVARSYRVMIVDSYVHHATDQNSGGQAYGVVLAAGTSNALVENNIAMHHSKPIVMNTTGGGNVIAYNYVDEAAVTATPQWQQNGIDDSHNAFTHHDLIEGNWTPNIGSATTHGNSGWHTHFRNYAHGINSSAMVTQNLRAVGMDGWTHDHAYVANVLNGGTVYEMTPANPNAAVPVYQLGRQPALEGYNSWDDGYAAAHIYRDANWDNVTNGTVWTGGARDIPPSLYLTRKPAFFGHHTWPWVDPTGTSASRRVMTLPAKARHDAGTPFDMTEVTLTTDPASPQPVGTSIMLTAAGLGGTPPHAYRFWVQPWNGEWQVVREWSPSAAFAWTPTAVSGYNVSVEARSSGATRTEVQAGIQYIVTPGSGGGGPMTALTLTTTLASPQPLGAAITLRAAGTGGTAPYAYRFWVQPWGGAWQIVRDWSSSSSYSWLPTTEGGHNVTVEARSSGAASAEVQAGIQYILTPGGGSAMTAVVLTTSLASPQPLGTAITLVAAGTGGTAPYAYRFWVQPWGGAWQIVRDWSATATHLWTPTAAGGYNVTVEGCGSGAAAAEVQAGITVLVNP